MEVDAKRRAALGRAHHQRRAVRRVLVAGVKAFAGPDGRQRQQVRQVQRVHDRAAHVGPVVAGKRAQPGLDRVLRLNARVKAAVADHRRDPLRVVERDPILLVHDDDRGRVVAVAHQAGRGIRLGGHHVFLHRQGIKVDLAVLGAEDLVSDWPFALFPFLAVLLQLRIGFPAVEVDEPRRPAVRDRERIEAFEQFGVAFLWEAVDADHTDVILADLRDRATDEILRADQRVEIHRARRQLDRLADAGDRPLQVREQFVVDALTTLCTQHLYALESGQAVV